MDLYHQESGSVENNYKEKETKSQQQQHHQQWSFQQTNFWKEKNVPEIAY